MPKRAMSHCGLLQILFVEIHDTLSLNHMYFHIYSRISVLFQELFVELISRCNFLHLLHYALSQSYRLYFLVESQEINGQVLHILDYHTCGEPSYHQVFPRLLDTMKLYVMAYVYCRYNKIARSFQCRNLQSIPSIYPIQDNALEYYRLC